MTLVVAAVFVAFMMLVGYGFLTAGARERAHKAVVTDAVARLGWRDESDRDDEKWPIRFTGTNAGIAWTISARPGTEYGEDEIWWTTDAVRSSEFLVVIGHTRAGTLDWRGRSGVQNYEEVAAVTDALVSELETTGDVEEMVARAHRAHPWLTMGSFMDAAKDVRLDAPELRGVEVKARSAELGRDLVNREVVAALNVCRQDVNSSDASIRIWLGAPGLRIHLTSFIDGDDQRRLDAMKRVVELGAALASSYQRVHARATG